MASPKETLRIPSCLGQRFKLKQRIGSGTFGYVFEAIDLQTGDIVAIKISSPKGQRPDLLKHEAHISEGFGGLQVKEEGFPRFYGFFSDVVSYMVMERLGPNLDLLLKFTAPLLSLKTTLILTLQMLSRLERFHAKGFIHRDLKPHNFTMGWGMTGYTVFLIDFGLSTRFVDSNHRHITFSTGKRLIGTPWYCSINAHDGAELSRRDDLESLFYVALYLLRGSLPWQRIVAKDFVTHSAAIRDMKAGDEMKAIMREIPEAFQQLYFHARSLDFDKRPNYGYLRGLLRRLFVDEGFQHDNQFEWVSRRKETRPSSPDPSMHRVGSSALLDRHGTDVVSVGSHTGRLTAFAPSAMRLLTACPSMASLLGSNANFGASGDSDADFPSPVSARVRNTKKRKQLTRAKLGAPNSPREQADDP